MSYDMIDRFLRNNLGDEDYAEYSAALDSLCTPTPAQQEPVAYRSRLKSGSYTYCNTAQFFDNAEPLYTSPPAQRTWVGLTDEDREQHRNDWHSNIHDKEFRAIEAKLKEKNQ